MALTLTGPTALTVGRVSVAPPAIFVKYILLVQRFTAAVFHVGFPCSTNLLNHVVWRGWHNPVISLFAAVFVCPVEELQHFCTLLRFLLLFVNQNEGGRGDWPRVFTFLISQVLSEGFAPVSAFAALAKFSSSRADRFAISRNQFGVGQVVLLGVRIFYVTDRARQTLCTNAAIPSFPLPPRPVGQC